MTEVAMSDPVEALILDLLEWIGPHSRPYAEVIEAWRTSCPRLPVWEEANERGLIQHIHQPGEVALVAVSASGRAQLEALRRRQGPATMNQLRWTDERFDEMSWHDNH